MSWGERLMADVGPNVDAVLLGPQIPDAIGRFVRDIQRDDPLQRVTVVTPSFYSSFYLRRALAPQGLFNVEFVRVDEVAELLAADAMRARGSRPLGRLQASELVHSAAMQSLDDSTALGRIRGDDATRRSLHRVFTELSAIDDTALDRLPRDRHFNELARAYQTYRQVSAGFHDRRTVAELAATAIEDDPTYCERLLGRLVVLLVEAPPAQYRPIWQALSVSPGVSVVLGLTGDPNADSVVSRLVRREDAGDSVGSPPLASLISAPSRVDEVKQVVRRVVQSARDGTKLARMAVLFADQSYGIRINDAFDMAGIPVCGPDPSVMAHSPQGRFLASLLRIVETDFAREAVMEWLTSSPVRNPGTDAEAPSARWDAISRSAGITGGVGGWQRRLLTYAASKAADTAWAEDEDPSAAEVRARSSRAAYARDLAEFVRELTASLMEVDLSSWSNVAAWLESLVERYLLRSRQEQGALRDEWLDRLVERIGALEELPAIEAPTFDRLAGILREELDRPLRTSRSLGTGVFVGSLSDAVGCDFDEVHIVGMREGLFPPPEYVDPLLPDDVRELLDPEGLDLPGRNTRYARDRRRFFAAMSVAPKSVLYWPRSESGAVRESAPAPWFVEQVRRHDGCGEVQVGDLMRNGCSAVERTDADPEQSGLPGAAGDAHEFDASMAALWRRRGRSTENLPLPRKDKQAILRSVNLVQARRSSEWTRFDGNLSSISGGFRAPPGPVSSTRFEKYAACPFRYFLGELAGVEPTERPEEELILSPLARGTLVHRILEEFVKARATMAGHSQEDQRTRLLDIAQVEFRKFETEVNTGHPAMWELEQRSLLRKLDGWLEVETRHMNSGEWGAHHVEKEFGMDVPDSYPPVEVQLEDGQIVEFRGVMDRVDVSADGSMAVVFDYKTGSTASYRGIEDDHVLRGTKLQLAVYSAAVRQAHPGVSEIHPNYWFVFEDAGSQLLPGVGNFDHDKAAARLRDAVGTVADGIRQGVFPARPGGNTFIAGSTNFKNCAFCEYDRICPSQRQQAWERKRNAGTLASYVRLTGDLEEKG